MKATTSGETIHWRDFSITFVLTTNLGAPVMYRTQATIVMAHVWLRIKDQDARFDLIQRSGHLYYRHLWNALRSLDFRSFCILVPPLGQAAFSYGAAGGFPYRYFIYYVWIVCVSTS